MSSPAKAGDPVTTGLDWSTAPFQLAPQGLLDAPLSRGMTVCDSIIAAVFLRTANVLNPDVEAVYQNVIPRL
jgi:hypothetical protein